MTAAAALPLLILLIIKGSVIQFGWLVLVLSLLGLHEFYGMALAGRKTLVGIASLMGILPPLCLILADSPFILPIMTLVFISYALYFLFTFREMKTATMELSILCLGFAYVPLLIVHLQMLRGLQHGQQWLLLLMLIVMSGDTAAYYVGTALGKRKLCPLVSPNKSVEGAAGGLAGSVIGAIIAKYVIFTDLTMGDAVAAALFLGTLGQLGDLFESFLKRSFGVKDSGAVFPGHGGVLDRLDSILFAAPAAYYYAFYIFQGR